MLNKFGKRRTAFLTVCFFLVQFFCHNSTPMALAYPITEWLLGSATVIAYTYFGSSQKHVTDLPKFKDQIIQEQVKYVNYYCSLVNSGFFNTTGGIASRSIPITAIMGIQPYEHMYSKIQHAPFLYGPICASARVCSDGDIEIILYVFGFSHEDGFKQIYQWYELGREIVTREHELVKKFIEYEDIVQLGRLREFVNSVKPSGRLRTILYDRVFSFVALQSMIAQSISPSLVLYTIKYGQKVYEHIPWPTIFADPYYNTSVFVHEKTQEITDVGYCDLDFMYSKIVQSKNQSQKKTLEDILQDAEQESESQKAKIYKYPGDYDDAKRHFEELGATDIVDKGGGFLIGMLPNGRTINIRKKSSDHPTKPGGDYPTLEIPKTKTTKAIKIRYINKNRGK